MITPFINDELNLKDIEEFIDHIHSCAECREELEVYYALLTAMKQLDEDKNLSEDYSMELSLKLEKAQEKIIHVKFTYYRKKGALLLVIILMAFFYSFHYSYHKKEYVNTVTKSNYRLRVMFRHEGYDSLDTQLQRYLWEQEESGQTKQ